MIRAPNVVTERNFDSSDLQQRALENLNNKLELSSPSPFNRYTVHETAKAPELFFDTI